jgi:hypothetical protein
LAASSVVRRRAAVALGAERLYLTGGEPLGRAVAFLETLHTRSAESVNGTMGGVGKSSFPADELSKNGRRVD